MNPLTPTPDTRAGRGCASVAAMVLLTGMIRNVAITGRTGAVGAWCFGRQGGRWADQTIGSPPAGQAAARTDSAEALRELTELHQRGVVTDGEFEDLRARLIG
jgi:hypothetical protein